ncbi:hypothetical protein [Variovorax sp. N23]|uniref:hypothetical protein n=1 Tax=Variovorax sp. N23 TaxID=2980555 RepID=UPI0021C698CC|nr:hypothetical protein [Variovorax sp. N23]MCU4117692.1 hypothetical protein [Variovorax sp. N23]
MIHRNTVSASRPIIERPFAEVSMHCLVPDIDFVDRFVRVGTRVPLDVLAAPRQNR